jgi:hypothetical protein
MDYIERFIVVVIFASVVSFIGFATESAGENQRRLDCVSRGGEILGATSPHFDPAGVPYDLARCVSLSYWETCCFPNLEAPK